MNTNEPSNKSGLLGYERLREAHEIIVTQPGERVLQRRPFRWKLDGEIVPNAYESFAVEIVLADHKLEVVHKFNDDLFVVRDLPVENPPRTAAQIARREILGQLVRKAWVAWAERQPNPKLSWLDPWEKLSEPDREVDRLIGEEVARACGDRCGELTAQRDAAIKIGDYWRDRWNKQTKERDALACQLAELEGHRAGLIQDVNNRENAIKALQRQLAESNERHEQTIKDYKKTTDEICAIKLAEFKERVMNVARGCLDHSGGHGRDPKELEIYHHGINTVGNALAGFIKDPNDSQTRALERHAIAQRDADHTAKGGLPEVTGGEEQKGTNSTGPGSPTNPRHIRGPFAG